MSKPSALRCLRSALRLISCCDIEDHSILDLDTFAGDKRAFWLIAFASTIRDSDDYIWTSRRIVIEGKSDNFVERQFSCCDKFAFAIHDNRECSVMILP